jgi:hypothetical protein
MCAGRPLSRFVETRALSLLLDGREGSWRLALHEPLRSILPPCPTCRGVNLNPPCTACACKDKRADKYIAVGRQLSRITTPNSEGGPDVLIVGQGPGNKPKFIAVEVKSFSDLLQSAHTGRLQAQDSGQLQIMRELYDQSWLLVYGIWRPTCNGGIEVPAGREQNGHTKWRPLTYNGNPDGKPIANAYEFLGRMFVAVAGMGVLVQQVKDEKEAARWVADVLYGWWSKPWEEHSFTRVFRQASQLPLAIPGLTPVQHTRAKRLLGDWPGLGPERVIAAVKHFGSILAMAEADEKEWMKVPGIGKGIAGHLVKAFRS